MIKSNNIISRDMLDVLRECKGKKLEVLLRAALGKKDSFEVVILRFKEYDLEIWNLEQPDKEDGVSDLAKIIVKKNFAKDSLAPIGNESDDGTFQHDDFAMASINRTISGITVHNELVKWSNEYGDFLLANTYAIVISLGTRYLHIVKGAVWSEIWDVSFHRTPVPKAPEWDESEGDKYEIRHSVFKL